ncbi:DinB family protein [Dysgonomonas sp. Marseille-P4677]|uniref:DinB family protein n=1 Tax=Dysgonomonas sp. Marseille-P4677 TaxID=2364790 RepID=UPI001F3ABCC3|nr:DinB family protein [Dysgonomonas sp. Marseille-P4677]
MKFHIMDYNNQNNSFESNNQDLINLLNEWEVKLLALPIEVITLRNNKQQRTIKQIVGHLIDSASNNTHRIVHLQYQENPLIFPDYAHFGNNDRWIAIQNYQTEEWKDLVELWKYSNKHLIHIIRNVNNEKLNNEWIDALGNRISLQSMIVSYLSHVKLHLSEIEELINQEH